MLGRMAAYDPSTVLTDGSVPVGGFATRAACVAVINLIPLPPVAEAAIALLLTDAETDAAYNKCIS